MNHVFCDTNNLTFEGWRKTNQSRVIDKVIDQATDKVIEKVIEKVVDKVVPSCTCRSN